MNSVPRRARVSRKLPELRTLRPKELIAISSSTPQNHRIPPRHRNAPKDLSVSLWISVTSVVSNSLLTSGTPPRAADHAPGQEEAAGRDAEVKDDRPRVEHPL